MNNSGHSTTIVVIGNGPAGQRLVERLRARGHEGPVTVLGEEPQGAYNRALLTSVLDGTLPPGAIALPAPGGATRVLTGTRAVRVDRAARVVHADDGGAHPYGALVLATGARPNVPRLPGAAPTAYAGDPSAGTTVLRTLADCAHLTAGPVAVLGGGVLGIEASLALRRAGREVTLIHPHSHPLNRQLDAEAGQLLVHHLSGAGVVLYLGRRAAERVPGKVLLDDGQVAEADTLLLCTGVSPDAALADEAGLAVDRGILVDRQLRTSDAHIYALGDCAQPRAAGVYGGPGGLESAWEQADRLAALLAGGAPQRRHAAGRPEPPRPVTRLKAPGLDLVSMGRPGATGTETVTFTDQDRGRHASLTLHNGRVRSAVLMGLPRAAAVVTGLYDRDEPVPADRLALLAGTDAGAYGGSTELPDEAVVCVCNNVTKAVIVRAWQGGARDLPKLAAATRATTGCGSCAQDVLRACAARPATGR